MGNEVAKKGYEMVGEQPVGSLGPKGVWAVYDARHKATGRAASVLMFDKRVLSKAKVPKRLREQVLTVLRRDIKALATLRHPHVVQVVDQVEESSKLLCVIVEPLRGCLQDVYDVGKRLPAAGAGAGAESGGAASPAVASSAELPSQFEVAVGALRVAEALSFLHRHASLVHMGVTPEARTIPHRLCACCCVDCRLMWWTGRGTASCARHAHVLLRHPWPLQLCCYGVDCRPKQCIAVTQQGTWKLAGFGFSFASDGPEAAGCPFFHDARKGGSRVLASCLALGWLQQL